MDGDRRGDWENQVNRNLVSLNTAIRQVQKFIEELDLQYSAMDRVLRGDSERDTDGLIARQHASENLVNELRAELRSLGNTVNGDHAGGAGHEQRINGLEGKRDRREKREGYFWHFVTAVAVQVLVLAGALILNWDRVEVFAQTAWGRVHHRPAAAAPAKARKSKRSKKKRPPPIMLPEAKDDESPGVDMP